MKRPSGLYSFVRVGKKEKEKRVQISYTADLTVEIFEIFREKISRYGQNIMTYDRFQK